MPSDPSSATKASLDASARYIEEKKVYELFEGLMADLLIKKPNDPIAHMIASLKQPPRPRVFVFGPPGADTQSQCELISSKLGLVHVVPKAVWREAECKQLCEDTWQGECHLKKLGCCQLGM